VIDESLKLNNVDYSSLPNSEDIVIMIPLTIGTLYVFQKEGHSLPTHYHDESTTHYSIIITGEYNISRDEKLSIGYPGDILNFKANEKHSITAITPGIILNSLHYSKLYQDISFQLNMLSNKVDILKKSVLGSLRNE
jgi:hypothetical protein